MGEVVTVVAGAPVVSSPSEHAATTSESPKRAEVNPRHDHDRGGRARGGNRPGARRFPGSAVIVPKSRNPTGVDFSARETARRERMIPGVEVSFATTRQTGGARSGGQRSFGVGASPIRRTGLARGGRVKWRRRWWMLSMTMGRARGGVQVTVFQRGTDRRHGAGGRASGAIEEGRRSSSPLTCGVDCHQGEQDEGSRP